MATTTRRIALAVAAVAAVAICTAQAEAQFRFRLRPAVRIAPPVVVSPTIVHRPIVTQPYVTQGVPYLGFSSQFDGSGELVTAVQYGATAWRIGLEPGDRIVAVNGVPLRYHGHGMQLLQAAMYRGYATLAICDVHTHLVVSRTLALNRPAVAVTTHSGYVVRRGLRPSEILRRLPR